MRLPLTLFLLFLISLTQGFSQRLLDNFRNSQYTLIYKLDSVSVAEIYSAGFLRDSAKYFVNPVDSFRYDQSMDYNRLKPGIYLFLSGEANQVRYRIWEQPVFTLHALGVNGQIQVYAYDLQGTVLKDARLKVISNGQSVYYQEDCGCYPIPVTDKKRRYQPVQFLLFHDRNFTYGSYSFNADELFPKKQKRKRQRQTREITQPTILPGYLVLNQPKFRQLDSLKWKAFLTKPNGKPYRKEVLFRLVNNFNGQLIQQNSLKPAYKGAYHGSLLLADSLPIDQSYSIQLLSRKGRLLKSETFSLENYDLKKAFFEAKVNKPYAYAGEEVFFTVSTFDVNNLPLPDAQINLVLSLSQIQDWYDSSLFVPFSWGQKYWEYETLADPGGITRIPFPDSLKINALMMMNAHITIRLPEGESKVFDLTLQYNPEKNRYLLTHKNDSIHATYLYNSKTESKNAILRAFHGKLLYEKAVILPYSFPVEEFPQYYHLISDSVVRATLDSPDYPAVHPFFEGNRTHDSLRLILRNPLNIPVNYKVFLGNDRIAGGSGKQVIIHRQVNSGQSIHVIYSYRIKGQENVKEQVFQVHEKMLTVKIEQPEIIYPGQKVPVNIHVTDYKNRGVRNANLAAYAVNAQLGEIREPEMPYFGKIRPGFLKTFQNWNSRTELNNVKPVNRFYAEMPFLANSPYHNLIFNLNGLGKVYESIEEEKTEFSPFVLKGLDNQAIYQIYLDNKPIYFAQTNLKSPYSFTVDPGTYSLQIRTRDKMLSIKNVTFKKGYKLFLCLSEDSLRRNPEVTLVNLSPTLLEEEREGIARHLLYFYPPITKNTVSYYFVQGNRVFSSAYWNHYNSGYGGNSFYTAGPFERGPVRIIYPGQDSSEFYFEPGYGYKFYDDSVTTTLLTDFIKNFPPVLTDYGNQNPLVFHERAVPWPVPVKKAEPQPVAAPVRVIRTHPALHDYAQSYAESGFSHVSLKNKSGKNIKWIWFFNKENEKQSRICFNPCYWLQYLKPGVYDVLIVSQNDSVCHLRDYRVQKDGTQYQGIFSSDFKPYDSVLIAGAQDRIVLLNRPGPRVFDNPPVAITDVQRILKGMDTTNRISGYIQDPYGNPIDLVTVFLESAGVFKAGAITNQIGYFELDAGLLNSGQLKIFLNGKYYTYAPLFIAGKKHTELQIRLPNASGQAYNWNLNTVNINDNYSSGATPYTNYDRTISNVSLESVQLTSMAGVSSVWKSGLGNIRLPAMGAATPPEPAGTLPPKNSSNTFSDFLEKIKGDTSASRIRSKFRDYAYFIPNLFTDRHGLAHFTVVFPDNQTLWKTLVPAMDYHQRTGLGISTVKAFKPLNATLALPKFCIEGDSLRIVGKIYNYTEKELSLTSGFKIGNKPQKQLRQTVGSFLTESVYLSIDTSGTFPVEYSFETPDLYKDGEQRDLPVLTNGIIHADSRNFMAEFDTSFSISAGEFSKTTLTITNSKLDLISKLADELVNYSYGCNEQNASKIIALLTQKTLNPALNRTFTEDKLIASLIRKLEKTQSKNGSWGWWYPTDKTENWMTIYIVRALDMAVKAGFHTRAHIKGAEYLRGNLNQLDIANQIFALTVLADFYPREVYRTQVEKLDTRQLSLQDHFRLIRLKQILNMSAGVDTVLSTMVKTKDGWYWGEEVLDFKTNIIPTSALAYEVLKNDTLDHAAVLKQIRRYFLTHTAKARNTIEQAVMLQTIVGDILMENSLTREINPEMLVNGQPYMLKKCPETIKIPDNSMLIVSKKGAPLYFSEFRYQLEKDPAVTDSLFAIKTRMEQKGKEIRVFEKSVPVSYQIEITAARATEYVMIEVPIPSSCFYADKNTGKMPYEVHREYFNDKVVVFCRNLPKGRHQLSVSLQPMFEGYSTLLPVKASLMYYPDHYGTNAKSGVRVKE